MAGMAAIPSQNRTISAIPEHTANILNVLIELKNSGKSDYTIKTIDKRLHLISKNTDINNPEAVLNYIANKQAANNTKETLCYAYKKYCKHYKIKANIPYYKPDSKPIKIPTKEKLEMFIAKASKTLATQLTISMETGLRPVELCNLKVKDIDLEQKLIYPNTAKFGAPRTLKISNSLQTMIQTHIIKNNLNPNDKIFKGNAHNYGRNFRGMRNNLTKKLANPTLHNIRLYDFRHYFATNLYAKTNKLLYVMQQMGHKRVETTMIYTQLIENYDPDYTCEATNNTEQAKKLTEIGYEYTATTPDGFMLYRKRK
jgi:integrase